MAIIAYPLTDITYNAADAQTYFSFRNSGINSYYDDFIVTAKESGAVTVSTGLGWMKPADFTGFSIASTSPIDIQLEGPHATLGRYDRIVARYTAESNAVSIVAKTGTPSSSPKPPNIERTSSVYELGFCVVYVGPGAATITDDDITDTRADAEICGIISDSKGTGRSELQIIFASALAGRPYTVSTPSGQAATGTVPQNLTDYVIVETQNTTYTINAEDSNGTDYRGSVEVGPYYGQYKVNVTQVPDTPSATLAENSWAIIHSTSAAGQASNYWDVGDIKPVTINGTIGTEFGNQITINSLDVDAFIIGINHNASREGNNKIHFQLGKISNKIVAFGGSGVGGWPSAGGNNLGFIVNSAGAVGNSGGWEGCSLRHVLGGGRTPSSPGTNTFLAALPSDLRNAMTSVKKYTDNEGGTNESSANITATTEYIWLPSITELGVSYNDGVPNKYEGSYCTIYEYFRGYNSHIAYSYTSNNQAVEYWTRSPSINSEKYWCYISPDSELSRSDYVHNQKYITPQFAV